MKRMDPSVVLGYGVTALAIVAVLLAIVAPLSAAFEAGRVTVTTTETAIWTTPARSATKPMIRICNRHTTPIFVGPTGVTTANGFEIINATCEEFRPNKGDTIFGIVAAATARVDWAVKER